MPKARKPAWSMELLPRAVFALGITGHRDLGANPSTPVIAATLDARFSLGAAIAVAALYGLSVYVLADINRDTWKPIAIVVFSVLPAMAAAFNGIRAYADLVRLSERSAMMAAGLARLRRTIRSAPMNYDRVAAAAARLAGIMGDELTEWRFVLESRWARAHRARRLGRSWFRRRRSRKATSPPQ